MCNNEFVSYLNTLHNYNAQNSNVFGEKNIENKYYKEVMVNIPICNFIVNLLNNEKSCMIVLTGHAGDGKTSLMYQALDKLNQQFDPKEKEFYIDLPNGKKCLCIKDYSEFSDNDKSEIMKKAKLIQNQGDYIFLVANTGPLISNFPDAFEDVGKDQIQTELIDLLDQNTGEITDFHGLNVAMINIVAVNNTFFAKEFLNKILLSDSWESCNNCSKCGYCHIIKNIKDIKDNSERVKQFITNHYIWISEYGDRLTIRSMTQQLCYMITGGLNCSDIKEYKPFALSSPNLFFGYRGLKVDKNALEINAVLKANLCNYDKKRLRSDEDLYIVKNYSKLFSSNLEIKVKEAETLFGHQEGWQSFLKRLYLFYNIQTNDEKISNDLSDVFSSQFERYVDIKFNDANLSVKDSTLVRDALSMLNLGSMDSNSNEIPITLNRESGYVQNVQLVIGSVRRNKIKLDKIQSSHSSYLGKYGYNDLFLEVDGKIISRIVDLPLLDYFDELKNGIINTNIDAQLSKGLETIKSELLDYIREDIEDNSITMILNKSDGFDEIYLSITDNVITDEH